MPKTLNLDSINDILGHEISNVYMIRYLDCWGKPLFHSDPIIIETTQSSVCLMAKSERLAVSDEWGDPFAETYVMGNPVYPQDIVKMRNEIGGYYIFKATDWQEFKDYIKKKILSYNFILDAENEIVGLILRFSEISMTFVVVGEECVINPELLPRGFRVSVANL